MMKVAVMKMMSSCKYHVHASTAMINTGKHDIPVLSLCSYVELLTSARQLHQQGNTSHLSASCSAALSLLHTRTHPGDVIADIRL